MTPADTPRVSGASRRSSLTSSRELWPQIDVVKPTPATEADVLLVHTPAHLEMIRRAGQGGGHWIDADTFVSPQSFDDRAACRGRRTERDRSSGTRVRYLSPSSARPAITRRRPGHGLLPLQQHRDRRRARCWSTGYERIAILDWDVHHGNGTQAIFYDDPRVLFVSLHQWPHYPGSGWFDECGAGDGEGFTVNMPLPGGSTDGDYAFAFANVVEPIVRQFAPQAILVSAGQDSHADDPLGGMDVTEDGFAHMAWRSLVLAQELL